MVRLAIAKRQPGADIAFNQLCQGYRQPIQAYIIRHGHSPQEAEDLTQGFFHALIAGNAFANAEAEATRVKLRAFLLTKLQSFLVDQYRHGKAQKRGGGKVISVGDLSDEQQQLAEPVDHITPDIAYQRQWLQTVFVTAMQQLQDHYTQRQQHFLFEALAPYIDPRSQPNIGLLATTLNKPEGTIKSDVSRLRAKWRDLIRDQIAATLDEPTPQAVEAELKELMGYR